MIFWSLLISNINIVRRGHIFFIIFWDWKLFTPFFFNIILLIKIKQSSFCWFVNQVWRIQNRSLRNIHRRWFFTVRQIRWIMSVTYVWNLAPFVMENKIFTKWVKWRLIILFYWIYVNIALVIKKTFIFTFKVKSINKRKIILCLRRLKNIFFYFDLWINERSLKYLSCSLRRNREWLRSSSLWCVSIKKMRILPNKRIFINMFYKTNKIIWKSRLIIKRKRWFHFLR